MDKLSDREQFGYGVLMARRSVFLLAALLLTVSCGGEQKGAAPPPPVNASTAPPTSPAPAATPFVSSADQAGAFAFVREYVRRLEAAYMTGDVAPLAPLRKSSCTECLRIERNISDSYQNGERRTDVHLELRRLAIGQQGPAFAKVTAAVLSTSSVTRHVNGTETHERGGQGSYYFLLVRTDNSWVVDTLYNEVRPI